MALTVFLTMTAYYYYCSTGEARAITGLNTLNLSRPAPVPTFLREL